MRVLSLFWYVFFIAVIEPPAPPQAQKEMFALSSLLVWLSLLYSHTHKPWDSTAVVAAQSTAFAKPRCWAAYPPSPSFPHPDILEEQSQPITQSVHMLTLHPHESFMALLKIVPADATGATARLPGSAKAGENRRRQRPLCTVLSQQGVINWDGFKECSLGRLPGSLHSGELSPPLQTFASISQKIMNGIAFRPTPQQIVPRKHYLALFNCMCLAGTLTLMSSAHQVCPITVQLACSPALHGHRKYRCLCVCVCASCRHYYYLWYFQRTVQVHWVSMMAGCYKTNPTVT